MRVLYVCADPRISPFGSTGGAAHIRGITRALAARGHAVTVACRRTDGDNLLGPGISVAQLPAGWNEQAAWLGQEMRRLGSDVVVERWSLHTGAAVEARRQWPIPLLLEAQRPVVDHAARDQRLADVAGWRRWEARVLAGVDHVLAVSEVVAWHALSCGAPPERVSVVPNGVDPARFDGVAGHSVRLQFDLRRSFVVGYCGSLKPWHGAADAVEALAMLPERVRLLVVGTGPERMALRARADSLGVEERVILAGVVPEHDVPPHLAAMDVGLAPYAPTARLDYSPLKLLEYCAAGLPVVATGHGEATRLGGAAVLVPPSSPTALAGAIAELADDPERREAMSAAARAHAAARTWDDAARRVEEIAVAVRPQKEGLALFGAGTR